MILLKNVFKNWLLVLMFIVVVLDWIGVVFDNYDGNNVFMILKVIKNKFKFVSKIYFDLKLKIRMFKFKIMLLIVVKKMFCILWYFLVNIIFGKVKNRLIINSGKYI